jgi:phosphate/sulfate permease
MTYDIYTGIDAGNISIVRNTATNPHYPSLYVYIPLYMCICVAVCIASVFEFLGAVLLGSQVVKTISKGIADVKCFESNPGLLMYGMTMVILTVFIWLYVASYFSMPVSTTHSSIGAVVGMTMMTRGSGCVLWYEEVDEFPYLNGVAAIVASWAISPVCSGMMSAALYGTTYLTVLRNKEESFYRATWAFPIIVGFTTSINVGMFVLKGAKGKADDWGTKVCVCVYVCVMCVHVYVMSVVCMCVCCVYVMFMLCVCMLCVYICVCMCVCIYVCVCLYVNLHIKPSLCLYVCMSV